MAHRVRATILSTALSSHGIDWRAESLLLVLTGKALYISNPRPFLQFQNPNVIHCDRSCLRFFYISIQRLFIASSILLKPSPSPPIKSLHGHLVWLAFFTPCFYLHKSHLIASPSPSFALSSRFCRTLLKTPFQICHLPHGLLDLSLTTINPATSRLRDAVSIGPKGDQSNEN